MEQGFAQILAGSGLSVVKTDSGNYLLRPQARQGEGLELDASDINGRGLGATTEGTGAYTTGATSTATKLNLSLREAPGARPGGEPGGALEHPPAGHPERVRQPGAEAGQ